MHCRQRVCSWYVVRVCVFLVVCGFLGGCICVSYWVVIIRVVPYFTSLGSGRYFATRTKRCWRKPYRVVPKVPRQLRRFSGVGAVSSRRLRWFLRNFFWLPRSDGALTFFSVLPCSCVCFVCANNVFFAFSPPFSDSLFRFLIPSFSALSGLRHFDAQQSDRSHMPSSRSGASR